MSRKSVGVELFHAYGRETDRQTDMTKLLYCTFAKATKNYTKKAFVAQFGWLLLWYFRGETNKNHGNKLCKDSPSSIPASNQAPMIHKRTW